MNRYHLILKQGGSRAADALVNAAANRGDTALMRQAVRDDPKSALALISLPGEQSGLTNVGRGRVLDFVMAEFPDPEQAREMVEQAILHEDRVAILAAHGDLPHAAADVLSLDDVIAAMLHEVEDVKESRHLTEDDYYLSVMLRCGIVKAWAFKLKDREDYEELLNRPIDGDLTIRDMVLISIATENGVYGEEVMVMLDEDDPEPFGDELTNDMFENLGINPEEGRERLVTLFKERVLDEITEDMIHMAKATIAEAHRIVDETPSVTRDVAQEAAAIASASDL